MSRPTVQEYRREFVEYFTQNHSYQFIRSVGDGHNGATALFTAPDEGKVVIKFANRAATDAMILNEKSWLGRFRGLEHFIQGVDVDEVEGAERPSRHWMAVEYLRHGDLAHLAQRAVHVAPFPNRVLWSFFLCLVRAAVGMARWSSPDNEKGRETMADAHRVSNIVHGSYKPPNICVGELTPHDWEHRVAPVLKMIDFGRTRKHGDNLDLWAPPDADPARILGVYQNMFDAAWTIQGLVSAGDARWRGPGAEQTMLIRTARGRVPSHVRPAFWHAGHVDGELRRLVGECLADDPADAPRLGALLARLEAAVRRRAGGDDHDDGPGPRAAYDAPYDARRQPMETDDRIAAFWRRVLFEPPDAPA